MDRGGIIRLVQTAAEQKTLEGVAEMLRVVTEELGGWGTLVWVASPGSDPVARKGRLFVQAYWVRDENVRVWHELTFDSMVGEVMKSQQPATARLGEERIGKSALRLLEESGSQHFCLAPMKMPDGSLAVLEVYRVEDRPFDAGEISILEQMAAVLPALYANLTDRVGFDLLDDISDIRRDADEKGKYVEAFQLIVDRIIGIFASLEVAMFLESPGEESELYRLVAYSKVWEGQWTDKAEYRKGEGATGWVLEHGKTVQIVDLARYEEDRKWIESQYPGLQWKDSLGIQDRARDYFGINDPEASPPLSFVCASIRVGDATLGAIRCAGATRSPFCFDDWQARFLEAAAVRIGAWLHNVLRQRRREQEVQAWEALTRGFDGMNRLVQRQLSRSVWDETGFLREAMRLAHEVIPNTDNSDVRLIEGWEFCTAATYGRDWEQNPKLKNARYGRSADSYPMAEKERVRVYDRVSEAPPEYRVFSDTQKLILAPVEAGDALRGVLCIRSKSPRPFPSNVGLIAGLLGQQLGLYHSLTLQIRNLKIVERQSQHLIETQARTLGDVHHQVKSPIISAHRTAQKLIENMLLPRTLRPEAERLRSLCSKVSRVVRNMGMFSDLSNQMPMRLSKSVLMRNRTLQMLREACADHTSLVDPERKIAFNLDEKSLQELADKDMVGKLVEADWSLLEQCVNNLLDNAAKYSFDRTEVRVSGGIQAHGTEFFVSVVNEGFELKSEDVPKLKQRGYRGDHAVWATGEGSGIGLWIVDEIMRAHHGYVAITPTRNGITDIRLVFPVTRRLERLSNEAKNSVARR
jgi:signal transduction histidine kinase